MKKTLKSFFCVLLSAIMAFSALCVFAAAQEKAFVWSGIEFGYAGEAKLGDNSFTVNSDSVYFDFTADEDGYYYVTLDYYQANYSVGDISVPLTYEEHNYEEKACYYTYDSFEDNDLEKYFFKLEKGNEKFMFNLYPEGIEIEENASLEFNVKYFGKEITGVVLTNDTDKNIILGYDLYDSWYSEKIEYEYYYELTCDFDVIFDNQEKLEFRDSDLTLGTDTEIDSGENEVNKIFFDYVEAATISVNKFSDFIESIEVTGLDNSYSKKYYDGSLTGDYGWTDETAVIVTYVDGSKKTFNGDTITLVEGGREYYWGLAFHVEDDKAWLDILINDEVLGTAPCEMISASYDENLSHLIYRINDRVFWIKAMVRERFAEIAYAQSAWEYFTAIRDALIYAGDSVVYIFRGVMEEIKDFRAAV